MKYSKGSPEFEFNLDAMHEMEDHIPMTRPERESLHFWVQHGHDIDTNPWKVFFFFFSLMNFLKALRVLQGYPHGPWDSWEYENYLKPDASGIPSILD